MIDLARTRNELPRQYMEAEDMGEGLGSPNSKLNGDAGGKGWFYEQSTPDILVIDTIEKRKAVTDESTPAPAPGVFSDNTNMTETGDNGTVFRGATEYPMFSFSYGNGLAAGVAGTTAQAKLSDPVESVEYHANTGPTNTQVNTPDTYATPASYEQSADGHTGGLLDNFGNPFTIFSDSEGGKTVRGMTMVFIVGAIMLALGIYALVK
jgi:hypothetical protein